MQSVLEKIKSIPGKCILEHELSLSSISNIYLGILNDIQAVIRLDFSAASRLAIDRQHEVNLLKDISHLDLAPKVLYSDISAGILIWEYIPEAQSPFAGKKFNSDTLYQLGSCLYSLHSHPIPQNSVDIFSNSMGLYQSLLVDSSEKITLMLGEFEGFHDFASLKQYDRLKALEHTSVVPSEIRDILHNLRKSGK